MTSGISKSLWIERPCEAFVREQVIPELNTGENLVRTIWSGISRGTERLVFEGKVPVAEYSNMRCPAQAGDFPFPVKYGYCAIGVVEAGSDSLVGRTVFALHPHEDRFIAADNALHPLPNQLPARRAVLTANMETALNAVWDSGAGPGDRILVVGAGAVGQMIAFITAGLPGATVSVADPDPGKADAVAILGADFIGTEPPRDDHDIVFHTSASAGGLNLAIGAAGREATVVEVSWYGDRTVDAALGGRFHSHRLRLISTQVGAIPAARAARWSYRRRLQAALGLLCDDRLDCLITAEVAFDDLPARLPEILASGASGIVTAVRYDGST